MASPISLHPGSDKCGADTGTATTVTSEEEAGAFVVAEKPPWYWGDKRRAVRDAATTCFAKVSTFAHKCSRLCGWLALGGAWLPF